MAKGKLNRNQAGMMEIFTEQVPYEIDMLRYTHERLLVTSSDDWEMNALIESFCIHARNLIDFFKCMTSPSRGYVAAKHFADQNYRPLQLTDEMHEIYGKLSDQIAHLTYRRTINLAEKIGSNEREKLYRLIDDHIENFITHQKVPYKSRWPDKGAPVSGPRASATGQAQPAGATGASGPRKKP